MFEGSINRKKNQTNSKQTNQTMPKPSNQIETEQINKSNWNKTIQNYPRDDSFECQITKLPNSVIYIINI